MMRKGICKLCLKNEYLCRESHIIPSFLYKILYGPNKSLVFVDKNQSKTKYNSEYESDILCKNCDNIIIGRLDDYAAKYMYREFPSSVATRTEHKNGRDLVIRENDPNYDYNRYKLFLLSVLWRSSVSSRPFFQSLKISPGIEEDLRRRIISGKAGKPDEYPCIIHLPPLIKHDDGNMGFNTLYMPTRSPIIIKKNGTEICEFVIAGTYYFFITQKPKNMVVQPSVDEKVLTMGFRTIMEQTELIDKTIALIKNHRQE